MKPQNIHAQKEVPPVLPFFEGSEFPVNTEFLLADGRRFITPDTPNRLSRTAWLYRVVPCGEPAALYQLRVRRLEGGTPLQEALPPGLDWQPVTVTGVRLQQQEYRLPLGFAFYLAYDLDANLPAEEDRAGDLLWDEVPAAPCPDEEEEETADQLLEELLADIDLCITLLNLELKWMRSDKTVEVAKLAEATAQLERMTRMKEEYRQALQRPQPPADAPPPGNLIRFPGGTN